MHEAKKNLSHLVEAAVRGEPFIIARSGKPAVRVTAIDAPRSAQRIGFMEGEFSVPEEFDTMGAAQNPIHVREGRLNLLNKPPAQSYKASCACTPPKLRRTWRHKTHRR